MPSLDNYSLNRTLAGWILIASLLLLPSSGFGQVRGSKHALPFGARIAGTYLAVSDYSAQILQVGADGNLAWDLSEQFEGIGLDGAYFSDSRGSWQRTGQREITAELFNINYLLEDDSFVGIGVTRSTIQFDKKMGTATATCTGATYGPGVNPLMEGASPIPGSEYTCGTSYFQKLSAPKD